LPHNFESLENNLNIDLETMAILLRSKAGKAALTLDEFINLSLANGVSRETLKAELLRDLNQGGRIFNEFRNSVKSTATGTLKRASDSGEFAYLEENKTFRWVAVADGNVCPDCIERHGQVKSMEDWESAGLPATGFTVCKEACRCVLIPEEVVKIDPISLKEVG
jgi:hypothetical protein